MTGSESSAEGGWIPEELSRRLRLLNNLRELRADDSELFDDVVAGDLPAAIQADEVRRGAYREYCSTLGERWRDQAVVEKSERGRRGHPRKWYPRLIEEVWIRVSFLAWRDGRGIRPACDALIRHGLAVTVFDTDDGDWQPIGIEASGEYCEVPGPRRLRISLGPEEDSENLRRVYYNQFPALDGVRRAMAEYQLSQYKLAAQGKVSIYTREMIEEIFPRREV